MAKRREESRERELYRFLEACQRRKGGFPSYREIAAALGWKSTNTVAFTVQRLVREGRLEKDPGRARSFRLKRYRRSRYLGTQTAELELHRAGSDGGPTGRTLWIDRGWFQGRSLEVWELPGEGPLSWGLAGGDCLVVDGASDPLPGDLALASVGRDVLVGKIFIEDRSRRLLVAEEPEEVLIFDEGSLAGDLLGRVVGFLRRFRP